MKIFIICSKAFYGQVEEIKNFLEEKGHIITLPNSFDDPSAELRHKKLGFIEHSKWKSEMIRYSEFVIENQDAVLVLNFEKHGVQNYIGGATFLEMYIAFRFNKKIYLYNNIPEGILRDEIIGFHPVVIERDLEKIN